MQVPNFVISPLFLVSFMLFALLYFRVGPDRRIFSIHFGLMFGSVALMLAAIFLTVGWFSWIFLAFALFWLGLSIYLLRRMSPPGH
jgi:hypothetical protein